MINNEKPNHKRFYHESELGQLPQPTWLIDNEIPEHGLTVLFGQSGSGKSFVTLDYAKRIAQTQSVFYVAAEGAYGYQNRVEAYNKYFKPNASNLNFCAEPINLLNRPIVEGFVNAIKDLKPVLIIFDTLARCMVGGDENSSKDITVLTDNCGYIQRELKAAVLLVHHTGKDKSRGARGSSAILGNADMMLELTKKDDLLVLSCDKAKDSVPFESKSYRLTPIELEDDRSSCVVIPCEIKQSISTELTVNEIKVIDCLSQPDTIQKGMRYNDLKKEAGLTNSTFDRVTKKMRDKGLISKDGPLVLTDKGKAYIRSDALKQ